VVFAERGYNYTKQFKRLIHIQLSFRLNDFRANLSDHRRGLRKLRDRLNPPIESEEGMNYAASGVDEPREQAALKRMRTHFARTLGIRSGVGRAIADPDHFGSLIDLGAGQGLAISTDGVGTKLMIAQQMKRYHDVAVDLVANNVNDILCMGAEPVAIVDYIGIDTADEKFLEEFADSFSSAAQEAGVSIVGGEIAQIPEMLNPGHGSPRFDLVATAVGMCRLNDAAAGAMPVALNRSSVQPGQILLGLASSGVHSNGLSLARKVLFEHGKLNPENQAAELGGKSLGLTLLTATRIYVKAVLPLLRAQLVEGVANISGGGLLTIARLNPAVSYEITSLPEPQPIFGLIAKTGKLPMSEMCSTFNMGLGMVVSVKPEKLPRAMAALKESGETPITIGRVIENEASAGMVKVPGLKLIGRGDKFEVE
jgi:phosphoribosylformylglycinamidine cyclo-ligase